MVPIGTIVDWFGDASDPDNVPYGWIPCGYIVVNADNLRLASYSAKWENAYTKLTTTIDYYCPHFETTQIYGLRITNVNGKVIPNLSGKFGIGADPGSTQMRLGVYGGQILISGSIGTGTSNYKDLVKSDVQNTLPPYMALQKLIKVL
jgi:hypothetical protein